MLRNRTKEQIDCAIAVTTVRIINQEAEAVFGKRQVVGWFANIDSSDFKFLSTLSYLDRPFGSSAKHCGEVTWFIPKPMQHDQDNNVELHRKIAQHILDVAQTFLARRTNCHVPMRHCSPDLCST